MKTISCAYASDKGRKRDHNEDSYSADASSGFFIVADGMGGYKGGAIASSIVVSSVRRNVSIGLPLDKAINLAHRNILKAVRNGIGSTDMGATAVALKVVGADYQIAWAGDSRAYLWDGCLRRLTRDHSFVQRMIDTGVLTDKEARIHPQRNVLTQALGAEKIPEVSVGMSFGRFYQDQKILLCSDGLTGELEDETIAEIVRENSSDQDCVSALIQAANNNEGKDNITVIIISSMLDTSEVANIDDTLPMEPVWLKQSYQKQTGKMTYRRFKNVATLLLIFLVMIIVSYLGYMAFIKN